MALRILKMVCFTCDVSTKLRTPGKFKPSRARCSVARYSAFGVPTSSVTVISCFCSFSTAARAACSSLCALSSASCAFCCSRSSAARTTLPSSYLATAASRRSRAGSNDFLAKLYSVLRRLISVFAVSGSNHCLSSANSFCSKLSRIDAGLLGSLPKRNASSIKAIKSCLPFLDSSETLSRISVRYAIRKGKACRADSAATTSRVASAHASLIWSSSLFVGFKPYSATNFEDSGATFERVFNFSSDALTVASASVDWSANGELPTSAPSSRAMTLPRAFCVTFSALASLACASVRVSSTAATSLSASLFCCAII